jgi:hypothetical protein
VIKHAIRNPVKKRVRVFVEFDREVNSAVNNLKRLKSEIENDLRKI